MGLFKRFLQSSSAIICAATLMAGCATTPSGETRTNLSKNVTEQQLNFTPSAGVPLVVLRYPAYVEADAKSKYYDQYAGRPIGGSVNQDHLSSGAADAIADSTILKSNFFALSLYREMAARLPEHSVLLSPHSVTLGADGKLSSKPMTQAENLPNMLMVDFVTYTLPDPEKMLDDAPMTAGHYITPLVTVRSDHHDSASTQGLLFSTKDLMGHAAANSRDSIETSLAQAQNSRFETASLELDFINHLNNESTLAVASTNPQNYVAENRVISFPAERLKMDADIIKNYDQVDISADPLREAFSKDFTNQIIALLNQVDQDKGVAFDRAAAIASFDESLAALSLVGSSDPAYQARLKLAERLLEAEQKYLSVQSLRLFDGVYNSEMGAQVRDMLKAEYEIFEERREIIEKRNQAAALSILGVIATVAIASQGSSNCSSAQTQTEYQNCVRQSQNNAAIRNIATNAALKATILAVSRAMSLNKNSGNIVNNYYEAIIPALDEQTSIQVDLIDSNETITAIRYEDLKSKLQTIYSQKQRAMDLSASRCSYSQSDLSSQGVWYGQCENGKANGTGYGVIDGGDGRQFEYIGYASGGIPSGAGYMIVHDLNGSYALEGTFSQGLANGVMRVSKSGQDDTLRRYSAGQDVGAAPSGSAVASPFNTVTAATSTSYQALP